METDNDFTIDIQEETSQSADNVPLPQNFITVGEIANDDVKIYIHQDVYNEIEKYSRSDITHELGTILIGNYAGYSDKIHLVISAFIEAKYTDATASTLTFTHETWDYVHKQHEQSFPDLKILGWQHTHPGYGIFLSNYDMFIQENFFNLPFQIAYVVDPKQNYRGFFQWKCGRVEKLNGFYIYDDIGKKVSPTSSTATSSTDERKTQNPQKATIILLSLLCTIVVFSSVLFVELFSQQGELQNMVRQYELEISEQNDNYTTLRQQLQEASAVHNQPPQSTESEKNPQPESEPSEQTTDGGGHAYTDNAVAFKYYTVEYGDTLFGICSKHGIDYSSAINIIKAVNGLSDPDSIYVGQILLMPLPI